MGSAARSTVTDDAIELMVQLSAGDARRALTALEVASEAGETVTVETIEQSLDKAAVRYDRDGDQHYDVISAFIKSVRGSDVDAALHYLARMLVAGEDPRFVARRLMILASEDIGMADPTALQTAVAAAQTVQLIGMPEAQLTLGPRHRPPRDRTEVQRGDDRAGCRDERRPGGQGGPGSACICATGTTRVLRSSAMRSGYKYAHDDPDGVVPQQYPPDELVGVDYYQPTTHGAEREIAAGWTSCGRSSAKR